MRASPGTMTEENMAAEKEERRSQRKLVMENVRYTFMPPDDQEMFDAAVTNISESGLCLVTALPLKDGQKIIIKNNGQFSEKAATVRWSQNYEEQFYKVGLEFDEPYSFRDTKDTGEQINTARVLNSTQGKTSLKESDAAHVPDTSLPSHQGEAEAYTGAEVSAETPDEETRGLSHISSRRGIPSGAKQGSGRGIRILPIFLIMLLVLGIVTGGIVLYRSLMQDRGMLPARDLICAIQVGAFRSGANAQGLLQEYTDKGYTVFIDERDVHGTGIMYKVLIGPFQRIEDTAEAAEDIRAKENIDPFVTCR